jgi:UDP-2,4-diacetamido-2,4,6-trideoxy-beta-L-altropyranose hydrolase
MRRVSIRCEGSATIGLGHVRRCLLLANELHALGASVSFVTRSVETLAKEVASTPHQVIDISMSDEAGEYEALAQSGGIQVIDLLGDTEALQKRLFRTGHKFLVIDGSGRVPCWARWLVDPYPIARKESFESELRCSSDTEYFGGADFALYSVLPEPLPEQQDNKVVICMGGGDDRGTVSLILRGLAGVTRPLEIVICSGALNPNVPNIQKQAAESHHSAKLLLNEPLLQAATSRARFGFCAGGVTCYEMASMGLVLMTLPYVENQRRAARAWEQMGAGTFVGDAEVLNPEIITQVMNRWLDDVGRAREISSTSRQRFRGQGAGRIALALWNELCSDRPKCRLQQHENPFTSPK